MTETSVIQEWKRGKKLSKFFYLHKMHWGLPSSPAFFECSLKEEMIRKETLLALSPNCALSLTTSIAPLLVWTTVIPHLDHCTGHWLDFLGPPLPYFRSIGNRAARMTIIPKSTRSLLWSEPPMAFFLWKEKMTFLQWPVRPYPLGPQGPLWPHPFLFSCSLSSWSRHIGLFAFPQRALDYLSPCLDSHLDTALTSFESLLRCHILIEASLDHPN